MAAVMTPVPVGPPRPARPRHLRLVEPATRPAGPRAPVARVRPASRATYWRRRAVAGVLGLALVVMAGRAAGAALGGEPLTASGPHPTASSHVVEPGDSLWSIAEELAPGRDPRPIVDALAAARHGAPLLPGETVTLPRR